MKKLQSLIFIAFTGLLIVACQPESEVSPIMNESLRAIVKAEDIPSVTNTLLGKLGLSNGIQRLAMNSSDVQSEFEIDWDKILQLVDSSGRQTYTFNISDTDDDPHTFYNLVLRFNEQGDPFTPFVVKYEMSEEFFQEYLFTGSIENFKGSITQIPISVAGTSSENNANNGPDAPRLIMESPDCPSETIDVSDSSPGGGGPGGATTTTTYVATRTTTYEVCDFYKVFLPYQNYVGGEHSYNDKIFLGWYVDCYTETVEHTEVNSTTNCNIGDGEVPVLEPDYDPCKTSAAEIGDAFPNASEVAKDSLASIMNENAEKFGINTKHKLQHFLSQAGHESGGFETILQSENLNYTTAERLLEVWPSRFSQNDSNKADPDDYVNDSEKLANLVYANRLGNGDADSGDGYKFRGRGIFQLTGKDNYEAFNTFYQSEFNSDFDFVENPNLIATDDRFAILSALWFYKKNVLDKLTINAETSVADVTEKINGGDIGLEDRKSKHEDTKEHIDDCEQ